MQLSIRLHISVVASYLGSWGRREQGFGCGRRGEELTTGITQLSFAGRRHKTAIIALVRIAM